MLTGTVWFDCLARLTTVTLGLGSQTARAALITVWSPTSSAADTRGLFAGVTAGTLVLWLETDLATLAVCCGVLTLVTQSRTITGLWRVSAV